MTTQIKKSSGGSFTTATLDAAGRVQTTDATVAGLATPAIVVQACQAVNEWHNQPNNTAATLAATKRAAAVGLLIQEV